MAEGESESHSVMPNTLGPHGLYSPWNSSGQNTGVGSLSLLQGIFPTQGSNPGFLHCRWILYQLSYEGNPKQWLAHSKKLSKVLVNITLIDEKTEAQRSYLPVIPQLVNMELEIKSWAVWLQSLDS